MNIVLTSAGKASVLSGQVDADLYIDCRGIRNPFRIPGLCADQASLDKWMVEENVLYINAAEDIIRTAIETAPTRNSFKRTEKPLTVCFFCLAGQHRSPAMKRAIAKRLQSLGHQVEVK